MSKSPVPDLSTVASPPRQSLTYNDLEISTEPLGAGGQAVVYEATVTGSDSLSKVALKEPKYQGTLPIEVVKSFLQEAATWQTIDRREREKPRWSEYEHIVGVIDTGEAGVPWIAMEYMDGGDLEERLDTAPDGIPVDEALWIGECLCRGLEIADEYGYSHLDVKPKNILFRQTPDGKWNVPKLADWGIARTLADETGTMEVQTVKYSAPEQFEPSTFGDPDSLTDLYQVGAVVYAMLTGKPPYTGSKTKIMRDIVLGDGPAPPSRHRSGLPEAVDVAVKKAMAKHKHDRYRGLQDFERVLRAIRTASPLPPAVATHIESRSTGGRPVASKKEESPAGPASTHEHESPDDRLRTGSWPMFQGDASRTGYHPHASAPDPLITKEWQFETGDKFVSSPVVVDGTVFVGNWDNNLYAVNATTGEERWAFETGDWIPSSPAVVDGTVFVGSNDGNLYAVEATTGKEVWQFETGDEISSSFDDPDSLTDTAVADGTVFVGCWDYNLYAVDASTGEEVWAFETGSGTLRGSGIKSSPAVADGTVFFGSQDRNLYAVDATTGEERWQFETGGGIESSPAVVDGTVFVGSDDANLYAVDATTGEERWHLETEYVKFVNAFGSSPAVAHGTVFVGNLDHNLYAVDATTGEERWAFETGDWISSSPAVADGTVFVGNWDNNLYAIDMTTGEERWSFETGNSIKSSPAVVDGTVFVGSDDGLYAVSEE